MPYIRKNHQVFIIPEREFAADVIVFRRGEYAVAIDKYGNPITISKDHAQVIQKALDYVATSGGGKVFVGKGEYIINARDDPNDTSRAVGLFLPDCGVEIVGEDMTKTILKLRYTGARVRVDFISNRADTVDNPQIDGVVIKNLTLDGSLIDWYNWSAGTGTYKYGEGIRLGISKRYFTNLVIKNIIVRSFKTGWGVAIGYTPGTTRHEYIRLENIRGEDLGRGVTWVALANYVKASNIYGKNIYVNSGDTTEAHVYAQESGLFAEIECIRGENVEKAIVNLASTLRCSVRGVKGIVSENGYLVRLINASSIQVSDVNGYAEVTNSGYGIYIENIASNSYWLEFHNIAVFGVKRVIYANPGDYTINNLSIVNIQSNKPAEFIKVNNLTIVGGRIYTGGTDIILNNCSNVLLDLDYSTISKVGTVTFRRNSDIAVFSGDGTTTQFKIEHGLVAKPSKVIVTPLSADAKDFSYAEADDTYIYFNFSAAPPSGTNNVKLAWYAEV